MLGALTALAGLSAFLLIARRSGGGEQFSGHAALPLGVGLVIVVEGCLAISTQIDSEIRSLPLAAATAVCYGVTAGLVRSLTTHGLEVNIFTEWELYAVAIVGPAGFLLNQNAFQAGRLISPVLAVITTVDPLVSIGLATVLLEERVVATPAAMVAEGFFLAVMTGGIVALAHRAPRVAHDLADGAAA